MYTIQPCEIPQHSLLAPYAQDGGYADCYTAEVEGSVSHAEYVEAFYTTAIFKVERLLLARLASMPSTDLQARELAAGKRSAFAAWKVESSGPDELLLSDVRGRTRSWLMVRGVDDARPPRTRLYFGSAVVPLIDARSGVPTMGLAFRALLGFHKLYSRLLLRAARARLGRADRKPSSA